VSLPAADDLFRPTTDRTAGTEQGAAPAAEDDAAATEPQTEHDQGTAPRRARNGHRQDERRPSGRVRHDEKMTVYVTADELLDLEHARLLLRRDHGLAVDRGRLVREAVAIALADLDASGEESVIVQRLTQA
jgi:hypothetical protein